MSSIDYGFTSKDVHVIDGIIEAIQELVCFLYHL